MLIVFSLWFYRLIWRCSSYISSSYFLVQVKSGTMLHHGSVRVGSEWNKRNLNLTLNLLLPIVFHNKICLYHNFHGLDLDIRGHKSQNAAGTWCWGFLVLKSPCRGLLVLESQCRGIYASTASFSFSLNLLCHIINVDMWVANWCKLFCIS